MKGLRICFVGWGDHVHLERWVNRFAGQGYDISVVSFTGIGRFAAGVRTYRIGLEGRGMRWRTMILKWLLWRIRPHIVHVHWAGFAPPVCEVWNGRLVITAWGSDIYREAEQPEPARLALRRALARADLLTCDSADLARAIEALAGSLRRPAEVVQWGVDTTAFTPGAPVQAALREVASRHGPVIFSARNFTPLYNQHIVLQAFAIVRQAFPDAVLLMKFHNGLPEVREQIVALAAGLGLTQAVTIFDSVPYEQMADFYRVAAVTVSIPTTDATPMALLEAMACGSVPVFSDLPSLREWIVDGHNGHLVPSSDPELLARRLVELLRQPALCREMARRNLDIVSRRGSETSSVGTMQTLYRSLAT